MGSRVFLSPETELFFVKTHIIYALAETTSEAYTLTTIKADKIMSNRQPNNPESNIMNMCVHVCKNYVHANKILLMF